MIMASNELNIKDILRDSENYLLRYRDNWCIYVDMAQQEVLDKLVDRKSWESPELVEGEIPLNLLWSKPRGYKMCVSGCPTTEEKVVQRRFDFLARTKKRVRNIPTQNKNRKNKQSFNSRNTR